MSGSAWLSGGRAAQPLAALGTSALLARSVLSLGEFDEGDIVRLDDVY